MFFFSLINNSIYIKVSSEKMKKNTLVLKVPVFVFLWMLSGSILYSQSNSYPIVDTDVSEFYNSSDIISSPEVGAPFYGQDAQYAGNQPSYTDNEDGTITDNITGLMWQKEIGAKISYSDAFQKADTLTLGKYTDWRVPSIKELYSLILFTGQVQGATFIEKFIDTEHFDQPLGNTAIGEREIDAQTWSSTQYVGLTMNGDSTVFGVNFIDGRIKGYPQYKPGSSNTVPKTMYFRMVRGNPGYGTNNFIPNNDGTISDLATGLMWQEADDGNMRDWEDALQYAEDLVFGGFDNWRLPNAKELQSIVDYSRSPQTSDSPAIDPIFSTTEIEDPNGYAGQYPYFWTSTTHKDGINPYSSAVYIAFGEAQGIMIDKLLDVHGAGAQRSDPKSGDINSYPQYFGPQGDVRYVYNAVRCVRDIVSVTTVKKNFSRIADITIYPNPALNILNIEIYDDLAHQLEVCSISGQLLETWDICRSTNQDISHLSAGVYFITIDRIATKKFIKQ